MAYLLGRGSAIEWLRYQRSIDTARNQRVLFYPNLEGSRTRLSSHSSFLKGLTLPIQLIVRSNEHRRPSAIADCHVVTTSSGKYEALQIQPGLYCSTPSFAFLQMANMLTESELLFLGMELCGRFSIEKNHVCFREQICTPQMLIDLIEDNERVRGRRKALAIARQVVEGSASPMESALTLILCAPQSWGGFGLPQPQLNKSIPVDKSIRHLWSEEYITPDLLWESAKLVLEYDSTQHHTTSRQLARDASRRDIFQQMGFRVISVTGFHMSRPLELERVATLIAQHLEIDAPRIDIEQWNDRMSFTAHMLTLATQPEKLLALPRPKNVKRNWSSRWEPLLPFDPRE